MVEFECNLSGLIMVKGFKVVGGSRMECNQYNPLSSVHGWL